MRAIVLTLFAIQILSVSLFALTFEISGYTVNLPDYTERTDETDNRIAQKRAWSPKRDVAFSAGSFQHPKAGLELHVAAVLAYSIQNKAEYLKFASQIGIPPESADRMFENLAGERDGAVEVASFVPIQVGERTGWHLISRNRNRGIWTQSFFLPGKEPREIVQITFGGERADLKEKDSYSKYITPEAWRI